MKRQFDVEASSDPTAETKRNRDGSNALCWPRTTSFSI